MIKHLVLSGGLYYGLHELGALHCLIKNDYLSIDNIEKIYGSSVGAVIGALLCLKLDWDIIFNYFINRPWNNIMSFDTNRFIDLYSEKGLFGEDLYHEVFDILLKYKNISPNITLKEFYEFSNIELNMFSLELNSFTFKRISYKTHPDMELITALHCTSAFPILFQPGKYINKYYVDGGLMNNYPLSFCVEDVKDKNEILGIYLNTYEKKEFEYDVNIVKYCHYLISNLIKLTRKKEKMTIKNQLIIPRKQSTIRHGLSSIESKETRENYINEGRKYAKLFLAYKRNQKLKSFT